MKDYLIYRHVNKINGKSYIGQTCNLKRRIGKDGSGYLTKNSKGEYRQIAFANAILKYGWNNFETEILIENLTIEEANFYEEKYIEEYKTCNPNYGYNIRKGGNNISPTEETRKRQSEARKHLSEESRKNISEGQKGRKMSEEAKKKISLAVSGEKHPFYGKHHTEEVKQKLREYNLKHGTVFNTNNPRSRKVICLETLEIFNTCKEAEQSIIPDAKDGRRVSEQCIKKNEIKKLQGYHFQYLEEYEKEDK